MTTASDSPAGIHHPDKLYIGGEWLTPSSDDVIAIISPDTEEAFMTVASARVADVDAAVNAARHAFDYGPWPRMSPAERADHIRRLAAALCERDAELGRAWNMQVGGLAFMAPHATAAGHDILQGAADLCETYRFEKAVDTDVADTALVVSEPVGVVAAIAAWNGPFMLMAGKLAPALAAGCTIIMKPAPETPIEAYIIAECADSVGFPPGVINLICADRGVSDHLVRHAGVDKVSFTGSTAVGRHIAEVCGSRLARYTLELGGKSAVLVLDDVPIETAAKMLTGTITLMSGQICSMLSRAIIPKHRHDALAEAIAAEMQAVRVGHSTDPQSMMGPIASQRQLEVVRGAIEGAVAEGAVLVSGGGRPHGLDRGYFVEPTLFANVESAMDVAQREIFGPVLSLIACDDVDDGIRIANDTNFGLNGSVLTQDNELAYRIGRRFRSGAFAQNGMRRDFKLPFGGVKQSGVGREGGVEGLLAHLEIKTMLLDGPPVPLQGAG